MNVVFVWTGLCGYMGSCWRDLASQRNVAVKIYVEVRRTIVDTAFKATEELRDLDAKVFCEGDDWDLSKLQKEVSEFSPDVIFIVGWRRRLPRWFAMSAAFTTIPKIMVLDMPFLFTIKKLLAPIILHLYLKRFIGVLVNGKSAAQYARWRNDNIFIDGEKNFN